ncbi:flavin-containing monooxygenase [Streptomyces cinereoruber]|uniref:flavin-containing monooxygenase n=1 Tax=Streptomyces cinereoruber TaxID=67260 RepID=UPI0036666C95
MEHIDVAVIGGGQSGLAAAHSLLREGLRPVVLEASGQAAGSWPHYYDSLTLFSPAQHSSLPGMAFGGDLGRYPHRDEVVAYLLRYAEHLDADIRTGHRVTAVRRAGEGFALDLDGGQALNARAVVTATGGFGRPNRPALPGLDTFTGTLLHVAQYRVPVPFAGQRVIVVGAGNSAVQVAVELAQVARVTLASRAPVRWIPQRPLGWDLHFWLTVTGLDAAPLAGFRQRPATMAVIDDGRYRAALAASRPDRRPMFTRVDGPVVTWADGAAEEVDAIILATGYRPDLGYLAPLPGALDGAGRPRHRDGTSLAHPRLAHVGLEWQRSLSSASLRGVGRDAARAARRIARQLRAR